MLEEELARYTESHHIIVTKLYAYVIKGWTTAGVQALKRLTRRCSRAQHTGLAVVSTQQYCVCYSVLMQVPVLFAVV